MLFIFLDCFCASFRVLNVSVLGMFAFSQMALHTEGFQKIHLKKPGTSNFKEMHKTQFHVRTFFLSAKLHHGRKYASTHRREAP